MRAVYEGWQSREQALERYTGFSAAHEPGFGVLLFFQRLIPWIPPRLLAPALPHLPDRSGFVNLDLRRLPAGGAAGLRRRVSADDEEGAGQQQRDAEQPLRAERDFVQAE